MTTVRLRQQGRRRLLRVVAGTLAATLAFVATAARGQDTFRLDDEDQWSLEESPEPTAPEGQLDRIRRDLAKGQYERAGTLASNWIERHPNHPLLPEAYLMRGDSWLGRGNEYEALFDYEYVARTFPGSDAFIRALQRELEIAKDYANGLKRKLWGMRIVNAEDEAEELLIRIHERAPGSSLAEQADLTLADFYFRRRDMRQAVDMYSLFIENYPQSRHLTLARRRLVFSNLADFKGPQFDATGLHEARIKLEQLQVLEPAAAQQIGADALLEGIAESAAQKMLTTARWYARTNDFISAEMTIRRLLKKYDQTAAAREALRVIPSILRRLPENVLDQAPDYEAYREALLGPAMPPGVGPVIPARIVAAAAALAVVSILAGCASDPARGWSTQSTFSADVKTIAIPIFENRTYVRDVEFQMTDALIKEILARTPWRIAKSAQADSILLGRIRSVELDQLSKSRLTGLSEEVIVSVTIDFEWRDLRTDQPLLERNGFAGQGLFVPSNPTGEPIDVGQFNAVQQMAQDIVGEMRSNW